MKYFTYYLKYVLLYVEINLRQICIFKLFYRLTCKYRDDGRQLRAFISKCFKALIVRILIFSPKPVLRCMACPTDVSLHLEILESPWAREPPLLQPLFHHSHLQKNQAFFGLEQKNLICSKKNPLEYILPMQMKQNRTCHKLLNGWRKASCSWEDQVAEEWLQSQREANLCRILKSRT